MNRPLRACVILTAHALLVPSPASAQEPDAPALARQEASRHYRRGVELYEESDFRAALIEFERAHAIAPNVAVLYNVAQAHYQLMDYAAALATFERYLREGGVALPGERRREVEGDVARLRARVARVTVTTAPPGAEVSIDGAPVGASPLGVVVSSGRRTVSASLPGRAPQSRVVEIAGGDAIEVRLALRATTPPPASAIAPPAPGPPSRPWVPIAWGATGALAVGAAVTGAFAIRASNDLGVQRDLPGATRAQLDGARNDTRALALAADLLGAATLASAGIALYVTLRGEPREAEGEAPAAVSTPRVRFAVLPGGLGLGGEF